MTAIERQLPSDSEAERMVLGCVLLDNTLWPTVTAQVTAQAFSKPSHRAIFRAMESLEQQRAAIDPVALQSELKRTGELEIAGGYTQIATLFDGVPRFMNIDNYVRIVREKAALRGLIAAGSSTMNAAFDGEIPVGEQLAQARNIIDAIDDPNRKGHSVSAQEAMRQYMDYVQQRRASGQRYDGLATGFIALDEMLGGLPWGTLNLIAARPGMGKTALLGVLIEKILASPHNPDTHIVFFSLEMAANQLIQRMVSSRAAVASRLLRTTEAWSWSAKLPALEQASDEIAAMPLTIDDSSGLSAARMAAELRKIQREQQGKKIVAVIDYLQIMQPNGKSGELYQRVTEISKEVTAVTKDLGCVTLAACQLSRGPESRADKRPNLGDMRDSGQLEQDAAVVIFPHRPSYYDKDANGNGTEIETDAELIIAKARHASTGTVPVNFDPKTVRYFDPNE